jgi:hypothetical protein
MAGERSDVVVICNSRDRLSMLIGSSKTLLRPLARSLATVTSHDPVASGPQLALPLAFLSARWGTQEPEYVCRVFMRVLLTRSKRLVGLDPE